MPRHLRSSFVSNNYYSKRLLEFALQRIIDNGDTAIVTQRVLAEELGVTQPMVHAVLHGRKFFGPKTLTTYATKIGMPPTKLVASLLKASNQSVDSGSLADLRVSDRSEDCLLTEFHNTYTAIEAARNDSLYEFDSSFDVESAFYTALNFLPPVLSLLGIHLVGASLIVHVSDDMTHAVSLVYDLEAGRFQPARFRVDNIPDWLHKEIDRVFARSTLDNSTNMLFFKDPDCVERRDLANQRWLVGDNADLDQINVLAIRRVLQEAGGFERPGTVKHSLVLAIEDLNVDEHRLAQVLFLAGKLGERVALYALEDRLRLAEILLDNSLFETGSDATLTISDGKPNDDRKVVRRFLRKLSSELTSHRAVAAFDIWRLSVNERAFFCPSPAFRFVVSHWHEARRRAPDGIELSFGELYERYFEELKPRAYGRTAYMVANRRAIVIQPFADERRNSYWNSAPFLGFSTFIGIPFIARAHDLSTHLHVSVLYIRCIGDVGAEEAKRIVCTACEVMQSDQYWAHFSPLLTADAAIHVRPRNVRHEIHVDAMKERVIGSENESGGLPLRCTEMWFECRDREEQAV